MSAASLSRAAPGAWSHAFRMECDQRFLWLGRPHREALEALYGAVVRGAPCAVLTGDVGAGKSMLADAVAARLTEAGVVVRRLAYPSRNVGDFWDAIVGAFGLPAGGEGLDAARRAFTRHVQQAATAPRRLLVIDEAQVLSGEVLTEVLHLHEVGREARVSNALPVFLVGEDELEATLAQPAYAALASRIAVRCRLPALQEDEVASYVRHRLACVDAPTDLFTPEALTEIAMLSRGLPRLINTVCARAAGGGGVDATSVERCGRELAWLCDDAGPASPAAAALDAVLRHKRRHRCRIIVAVLTGVAIATAAVTIADYRLAASRRPVAAGLGTDETPVAQRARLAPVGEPPRPGPDVQDDLEPPPPARREPGDRPPTPARAPSRPAVRTMPPGESGRSAAGSGSVKSSERALPNPGTARDTAARAPHGAPEEPDPSAIIEWLLTHRAGGGR
jgi:type II secretory pathway predicted ATPase ExeA